MKLSPVNALSFKAKYLSNATLGNYKYKFNNGLTKEQIAKDYDSQIAKIELQKQKALELEDFMQSDEVQAIIAQLPAEDEVISDSLLTTRNSISPVNKISLDRMKLYYMTDSPESISKISRYDYKIDDYNTHFCQCAQARDGKLDKAGIITWLKELVGIVNGD